MNDFSNTIYHLYNSDYTDTESYCSKCNNKKCKCKKLKITPYACDLCLETDECTEKIDLKCVYLNLNKPKKTTVLSCLGIKSNTNAQTILEIIGQRLCNTKDEKVKVSINDTTLGFLLDKIELGECLTKTILSLFANEKLKIEIDYNCLCNKLSEIGCISNGVDIFYTAIKTYTASGQFAKNNCNLGCIGSIVLLIHTSTVTKISYINQITADNLALQEAQVQAQNYVSTHGQDNANLNGTCNCNSYCSSILSWNALQVVCNTNNTTTITISVGNNVNQQVEFYDYSLLGNSLYNLNGWVNGQTFTSYTSATIFNSNNTLQLFKARIKNCTNYIDGSALTCNLGTQTYTAIRSAQFTKNNCDESCTLTIVTFTKTYTSQISQVDANNQSTNDSSFNTEGQAYANLHGICLSCSCVLSWQDLGNLRCNNCTNEKEQSDGCGNTRWTVNLAGSNCILTLNWQNTGVITCVSNINKIQQRDINPCSLTFNVLRTIDGTLCNTCSMLNKLTININSGSNLCLGDTVLLTAVGCLFGYSNQWYRNGILVQGEINSSIIVSYSQYGSYTVSCSCSLTNTQISDLIVITQQSSETCNGCLISAELNTSEINCNNTHTVVVAITSGLNTNLEYSWSLVNNSSTLSNWQSSNTFIINNDNTLRYFFVRKTNCTAIFAGQDQRQCYTGVLIIEVSGGTSLCNGESVTLTGSGCCSTYKWYKNGIATGQTGNSITVNYDNLGTYNLTCLCGTNIESNNFLGGVVITQQAQENCVTGCLTLGELLEDAVNCNLSNYGVTVAITSGSSLGVEYGWSTANDYNAVSNWQLNNDFTVNANNITRYFFFRKNGCVTRLAGSSIRNCLSCTALTGVTANIVSEDEDSVSINVSAINGSLYRYCNNLTFICSNTCVLGDGLNNTSFNYLLEVGESVTLTIRVYNTSVITNCSCYTDLTKTFTNNFQTCTVLESCTII